MSVDVLVCVATEQEGAEIARHSAIAGKSIAVVRTGVGPVNAAHATTLFLARHSAAAIVACGVGGAYPGAGLEIGDVVCAETEYYADLGAESPDGFLDMEILGYPVVPGPPPLYNRLPLSLFPAQRRLPFVTRSTCTGTEVADAPGAIESMEGGAVVHVALRMGVPVGEVRGISNLVGNRDRASWRVAEAARAAQASLIAWIEAGAC
jgi:futalosine hydrolase